MATHDYIISNASGAAVRADLNNALAAIASNNSSATEPTTTYAYQWWADTGSSPTVMKLRNAANSAWITLFQLDGEWSLIPFENGTAAAPSIYFKDSGTDTGLFSGGTDQVNVTTGGVERVEWGASEVVFNDGGENYDFRIESDTNANIFFVDASANAVGIGTSSFNAGLLLQTAGGTSNGIGFLTSGSASVVWRLVQQGANDGSAGIMHGSSSARDFYIKSDGGGSANLLVDGKVGIGSTAPTNSLEVAGTATSNLFAVKASSSGDCLGITARSAGNGAIVSALNSAQSDYEPLEINGELIYFQTRTGAGTVSERARIDSSGRLLVGTSSARSVIGVTSGLEVEGTTFASSSISLTNNANDNLPPFLSFGKSRSGSNGGNTVVQINDFLGQIQFGGADGTDLETPAASIACQVDGTPGANDMPGRLVFSTTADGASSPTEAMRIDKDRGIQTYTNQSPGFMVSTQRAASTSVNLVEGKYSATGVNTGTLCFIIRTNGQVENSNGVYGTFSDIKLKENINPASSQWDDIKQLNVVNYNYKEETGYEQYTQIGVIAQELEQISPGLVSESQDRDEEGNDLGTVVKYSVLYMKAVKALQEAMERIETLEAKVADLESA